MNKLILCISFFTCYLIGQAQVGINTVDVNDNLMLQIKAKSDKLTGLSIPTYLNYAELSNYTSQIDQQTEPIPIPEGTMVYLEEEGDFCFYHKGNWLLVNPWKASVSVGSNKITKTYTNDSTRFNTHLEISKNLKADTVKANVFEGYGTIPIGGIIMWSGKISDLEGTGFSLCKGEYYYPDSDSYGSTDELNAIATPDLRGRFVVGYDEDIPDYDKVANTGGKDLVSITEDNLPMHEHNPGTLNIIESGEHHHSYKKANSTGDIYDKFSAGDGENAREINTNSIKSKHSHEKGDFRGKTAIGGGKKAYNNHAEKWEKNSGVESSCSNIAYIVEMTGDKDTQFPPDADADSDSDDDVDKKTWTKHIGENDLMYTFTDYDKNGYPTPYLTEDMFSDGGKFEVDISKNELFYRTNKGKCYTAAWNELVAGTPDSIDIRPLYYTIAYIIRVK